MAHPGSQGPGGESREHCSRLSRPSPAQLLPALRFGSQAPLAPIGLSEPPAHASLGTAPGPPGSKARNKPRAPAEGRGALSPRGQSSRHVAAAADPPGPSQAPPTRRRAEERDLPQGVPAAPPPLPSWLGLLGPAPRLTKPASGTGHIARGGGLEAEGPPRPAFTWRRGSQVPAVAAQSAPRRPRQHGGRSCLRRLRRFRCVRAGAGAPGRAGRGGAGSSAAVARPHVCAARPGSQCAAPGSRAAALPPRLLRHRPGTANPSARRCQGHCGKGPPGPGRGGERPGGARGS